MRPAGDRRPRDVAIVLGIITAGLALRLFHLGGPSFWLDEALSVDYARLSWPRFVHLMASRELNMLPYYLILRGWIHLGIAEWVVRSLSVICSVATLPIFYRLGVRLFGERAGQIGVALLALHPYDIHFAQEARGYSLMLLLVTGSTLLFVRATEEPSRHPVRGWVAYVAVSVLAVYAHFYAGFALLAQWISLAIAAPRDVRCRGLALSVAAICILLTPIAAFVLMGHADPAGWIPHPTIRRVEYLVYSALGGDNSSGARVFAYPVFAAALWTFWASARAAWWTHRGEPCARHYSLVVAGATLPILLVLTASITKPIFVDKYLVECLPFMVSSLAVGLHRLRPRALSWGALSLVLALSVHAISAYYRTPGKDDWRAATGYILASARPGDVVQFFPRYANAPFDYYRAALAAAAESAARSDPDTLGTGVASDSMSPPKHRYERLWAVFNQDAATGTAVRDSLSSRYPQLSDRQFTGVRVVLYDTR